MKGVALALSLLLLSQFALAWVERVDAMVLSANGFPISGAEVKVTYQKNAAGKIDTTEMKRTGADGVASFFLNDQAPAEIIYDYNLTVTEPFHGAQQFLEQSYDVSRGGMNRLYFVFDYQLYNITVFVRNELNAPVAGATVTAQRDGYNASGTTGADGSVSFMLTGGAWDLTAVFDGTRLGQTVNVVRSMDVRLAPPPPTNNTVVVRLLNETGGPVANLTVRLDAAGEISEQVSNATGQANFTGIRVFFVRIDVFDDGRMLYSTPLTLTSNYTVKDVGLDMEPPRINGTSVFSRNVGNATRNVYEVTVDANVSDLATPYEALNVTLHYRVGAGMELEQGMVHVGGGQFEAVQKFSNIDAPFDFSYYVTAVDSWGNTRASSRETVSIQHTPPIGAATPTPTPSQKLPEPLRSLLTPLAAVLESITTYMWVLIFVVLIVLGGTIFVFLAVGAFFYMKKPKKRPEEGI